MVSSKIVSIQDDEDYVNLMVYGKSGVGKTVLAGSARRVLFLAPEDDGTISAKRRGSTADKWRIGDWDDLGEALEYIVENIDEIQDKYDWIAIDSITHMQDLLLRKILDDAVDANPDRDPDIPAIQDHQKWQNMFKRFVLAINALPMNIIWTGLVMNAEDQNGDEFVTVDIKGKGYQMAQTICSYMTSYGYMEAKKVVVKKDGETVRDEEGNPKTRTARIITWEDQGTIQGKDRTGVLAPRTINKNLQKISDMIFPEEAAGEIEKGA